MSDNDLELNRSTQQFRLILLLANAAFLSYAHDDIPKLANWKADTALLKAGARQLWLSELLRVLSSDPWPTIAPRSNATERATRPQVGRAGAVQLGTS